MLRIGDAVPPSLADARVLATNGSETRLGSLWEDRDALVVFVRHFACAGCSEHVTELAPRLAELDRLGVRVVLVGCGGADEIAGFVERQKLDDKHVQVFTDPTREAFRRAGFVRSVWGTVGPLATVRLLRALVRGHENHPFSQRGAFTQQGGTILVRRGGTVALYDRAEHFGDHAPIVDVVDVALTLRAAESGLP